MEIRNLKRDTHRCIQPPALRFLWLASLLFLPRFFIGAQAAEQRTEVAVKAVVTLENLLQQVEKNSDYVFFYSDRVKPFIRQQVQISDGSYTVEEALALALTTTGLTYEIREKQISLLEKTPVSRQGKAAVTLRGQVVDAKGEPVIGVNVVIDGTATGVATDLEGNFELKNVGLPVQLAFTSIGYEAQRVIFTDASFRRIVMQEKTSELDEVVVTAWGVEKKTTMVGSVSSIDPKELKGPTSNLTSLLAGRVAGLVSYQLSGEPGRDNAQFFVRGVGTFGSGQSNPLILINGIESTSTDLARIQPDDIEGFSVLKDATATSMYGTRGANGVLLITTKSGRVGLTKFSVRYEASVSTNAREYNLADNLTYMELANEASMTRDPLAGRLYSPYKIENTRSGSNPLLFPSNNWKELMIKDHTWNHRVNLNVSGGTERARYYLSGTYRVDNGVLKENRLNDFNTNVRSSTIEIRSNIDLTLTKTTQASVRVSGLFDALSGPSVGTGSDVFRSMLKAHPVAFPAVYPQRFMPWVKHPLFGNASRSGSDSQADYYYNPYASALSGYSEESHARITAQIEVFQDFGFLLPGLKARLMAYTKRNTFSKLYRTVVPFYYKAVEDLDHRGEIRELSPINPDEGREYLDYNEGGKEVWNENSLELSADYNHTFGQVHAVGATFLCYVRDQKLSNAGSLERSLPQRNVSLSGRLTYGFDNRYLAEFNFGYNASERFNRRHRWGFFPSMGLAWNLGEEAFMVPAASFLDKLKLRVSYGLVGNDNLTDWLNLGDDRFFYLDMMNMNAGTVYFGKNQEKSYATMGLSRYGNPDITWEKSYKTNLALEVGLFRGLTMEIDWFYDKRTNILLNRSDLPKSLGLSAGVRTNVGEMSSQGVEASADYNKALTKDMWLSLRGTFTFATNEVKVYEEPDYPAGLKHLSNVGYPWGVLRGYIAERLFIDEEDVANSPAQVFGKPMAGDIKYRDVNNDGKIDVNDKVPMGYPSTPEMVYGFGFSFGYKDFDISAFFQGQARTSFMIDPADIQPFVRSGGMVNGLLDVIARDHWSEENRNPYAFYPRLSTDHVENNMQPSSWWLRDGSFLRLKTVEIGYAPKSDWLKSVGLSGYRVYVNGMNLLTFSRFRLWDIEMKGNGLGYPLQRVFNMGIQVNF